MTTEDILVLKEKVLGLLLAGDHAVLKLLRDQRANAVSKSVEITRKGFFVNFDLPPTAVPLPEARSVQLSDVEASVKGIDNGMGFVLFIEQGFLSFLEGYTYGEDFSQGSELVDVTYSCGAKQRDMMKLEQALTPGS